MGTYILCGSHLLRCSYNMLYFLWLYNEFFIILYNILENCLVRLLSNYNIKYTWTIYTRLDTCLISISSFFLRDKVTLRLLWSSGLGRLTLDKAIITAVHQCEVKSRREKNTHMTAQNNLMLTLFGLIFRHIYNI